jgi:hypothetical protein
MTGSPSPHDDEKESYNQDTISEIGFHYMAFGAISLRFFRDFLDRGGVLVAKTNSFLRKLGYKLKPSPL